MDKIKKPVKQPTKNDYEIHKQVLEKQIVDYGQRPGNNTDKIEFFKKKLAKLIERGFKSETVEVSTRQPIFEIWDGDKRYKIWWNGDIEGFGENAVIFNMIPDAITYAMLQYREHLRLSPTHPNKSVKLGLSHFIAPWAKSDWLQNSKATGEK